MRDLSGWRKLAKISITPADMTRHRLYEILEHRKANDRFGQWVQRGLIILILANVIAVVLETMPGLYTKYQLAFDPFEIFSVVIFGIEYLLRVWTSIEDERYQNRAFPRLAYMASGMALIDLAAFLPSLLSFWFIADLRVLRALRLLRIFKLTRYSSAMSIVLQVLWEERHAFIAAFFIMFVLLIIASTGVYLTEHVAQPEKFGSIPEAMWWAVATLTTVGYGDVTPITPAGKVFGGLVMVLGIGMAALPAGILASGFTNQLAFRRERLRAKFRMALEDGHIDAREDRELRSLAKELGISAEMVAFILEEVEWERGRKR